MEGLKILIADDEYWTREKLRTMIDWKRYGLTMLEPAKDGEEALQRMEAEQPDILITDINMPFLSGVELLQKIQEKYPDTITFVISGYDDFEYVKDSFLAGSINYLVKPVSRIDLVNAIVKALDMIVRRNQKRQAEASRQEEYLKASSLIQDREFSQLLEQKALSMTPDITMNSPVNLTGARLMLIKLHDMTELALYFSYDMNLLSYKLKQRLKELLPQECTVIFNYIYRSNEFLVISEAEGTVLEKVGENLIQELGRITQSPISVVINERTCSMDNIYQAYVQAVSLLMTRSYTKESKVLLSGSREVQAQQEQVQSRISEAQRKELYTLWKNGNKKAVREMIFERIGMGALSEQKWQYLEVKQTAKRIVNTWEECVLGSQELWMAVDCEEMAETVDRAVDKLDAGYLGELLEELIELAADTSAREAAEDTGSLMRQAAAYIDENYFDPLTLSSLAEKYHMGNSYFSRCFRKEMGENLVHYLSRTRIEKAKEHMKKGDTNLAEIAFMVGYDDYIYFSKVFRKFEGVSPREYRQGLEA